MTDLRLASCGDDIKIWDCAGYSLIKQFNPHSNQVCSLDWSCDNSLLASTSSSGDKIVLTHCKSAAYNTQNVAVGEGRTCVAFNSTARYLLMGGPDTTISVYDLKRQKLMKTYKDHRAGITSVIFNWNDTYVASSSESGQIVLYNVVTGQGSSPLVAPKIQAIRQLQYSFFKKSLLASVSDDGAVNLWDTNSRRLLHSFSGVHRAPAMGIAFSPINEMLLTSVGLDKRIVCYDVQGKTAVKTMVAENPLTSIDIHHDGCTLAVGTTRGNIFIYDLRQGATPVRTLSAHKGSVQCLKFQCPSKPTKMDSVVRPLKTSSTNSVKSTISSEIERPRDMTTSAQKSNQLKPVNSSDFTEADVFSPLREAQTDGVNGRPYTSVNSENRPDLLGKASTVSYTKSSSEYTDGVFSPLNDNTNTSQRRHPIGGTSDVSPPLKASRPITTGLSYDFQTPIVSNSMQMNGHDSVKQTNATRSIPGSEINYISTGLSRDGRLHSDGQELQGGPAITVSEPTPVHVPRQPHELHSDTNVLYDAGNSRDLTQRKTPRKTSSDTDVKCVAFHGKDPTVTANMMGAGEGASSAAAKTPDEATAVQPFQLQFIKNIIEDVLEDFRDQVRRDILNLHMETIRQFQIQQEEMKRIMQQYSVNEDLVTEIERLRLENEQLKRNY